MEQVRRCTVCPMENWLGTSKTTYRVGWMIWMCYSHALERRCLILPAGAAIDSVSRSNSRSTVEEKGRNDFPRMAQNGYRRFSRQKGSLPAMHSHGRRGSLLVFDFELRLRWVTLQSCAKNRAIVLLRSRRTLWPFHSRRGWKLRHTDLLSFARDCVW